WTSWNASAEWFKAKNNLESNDLMRERIKSYELQLAENPKDRRVRTRLGFVCHHLASRLGWEQGDATAAEPLARRAAGLWEELSSEFPSDKVYPESLGWMTKLLDDIRDRTDR